MGSLQASSIPRFLLPRRNLLLRSASLTPTTPTQLLTRRQASTTSKKPSTASSSPATSSRSRRTPSSNAQPTKPLVLEKPARFNPPSHPARLPRQPRNFSGPRLTDAEMKEKATKQYPRMMPAEGTFLNWFLTNRGLHVWISMSILFSLAFYSFLSNFLRTTPYGDMLPERSLFFSHPFQFLSQYLEVYKLHSAHISAQTAERRKKKVDDALKREEYRKAHGMEGGGKGKEGWTSWLGKEDKPVTTTTGAIVTGNESGSGDAVAATAATAGQVEGADAGVGAGVVAAGASANDAEPRRKPVKRWFGIWE